MSGLSVERRFLSRGVAIAAVLTTAATALTVLAFPAAAEVSGCAPCVVANTSTAKTIVFTTSTEEFSAANVDGTTPTVALTGPDGTVFTAGTVVVTAESGNPALGKTVSATFDNFRSGGVLAAPGRYDVTITGTSPIDSSTSATKTDLVTVTGAAPSVGKVSPSSRAAGGVYPISVTGFNFALGDDVYLEKVESGKPVLTKLTVAGKQITDNAGITAITGSFSLASIAPGSYDVVVTHPWSTDAAAASSSVNPATDGFVVSAPPAIATDGVKPAAVGLGAGIEDADELTVKISATGFPVTTDNGAAVVTVEDGVTATVKSIQADPDHAGTTIITATLTAARNAAVGAKTLTLTDTRTGGTSTAPFTVQAAPTVTAVNGASPATVGRGASTDLVFSVPDLTGTTTIAFDKDSGIQPGTQVPDVAKDTITVPVRVTDTAPLGQVGFAVIDAADGGQTSYPGATTPSPLQVTAAPQVTSVSPANVPLSSVQSLTINGDTTLVDGMTVEAPDSGGHITFGTYNATAKTVPVTVDSSAATGPVTLEFVNPDGGTSTKSGLLSIDAFGVSGLTAPTTNPTNASGSKPTVTLTGSGIPASSSTSETVLQLIPNFAPDDPNAVPLAALTGHPTSVTSTQWTGTVDLAHVAAGPYLVKLVNGSKIGTCSCTLTVVSAGAPSTLPTPLSPAALGQNADTTLTIHGENFTPGAYVTFSKPTSFQATGPAVLGKDSFGQTLTVPIHVAKDASTAAADKSDVKVTVPGSGTVASRTGGCSACLAANPAPTVTALDPKTLGQGATTTLTITGTDFAVPTDTVKGATVTFGNGVTAAGDPTVTDTSIAIPVAASPTAPASVSLTVLNANDGGKTTTDLPIAAGPTLTELAPTYVPTGFAGTLTITGSGFSPGAVVSFGKDSGVAVADGQAPTVDATGTGLSVPVAVTRTDAAVVDVVVTNADTDQGAATCAKCLGVAIAPVAPTGVTAALEAATATVSWTAVPHSGDGGAPISGYTVSVAKPTDSGVEPQTVDASKTKATFTGLTGSVYTFAVVASNAAGLDSPAAKAATGSLPPTTVTIRHSAKRLVFGHKLTLSGKLKGADGAVVPNARVIVTRRTDSGSKKKIGSDTTDGSGRWSLVTKPKHNADYRAVFRGNDTEGADRSSWLGTNVAPRIGRRADRSTSVADALVVKGAVAPRKAGEKVKLVVFNAAGNGRVLDTTKLSATSTYRFSVSLARGVWRIQVFIGRTSGNVAGHSKRLKVTRS